jgi:signal transduction histidine kinase/CheY-like chemotaxis protein
MGSGIGVMHYTGMAAMRLDAGMFYDPVYFAVSVVVAVVLATLSLYAKSLATSRKPRSHIIKLSVALLMGCAISGMHYTAMAAAYFFPSTGAPASSPGLDPMLLALIVSVATVLILALAIAVAKVDTHLKAAAESERTSHARMMDAIESISQGISLYDSEDRLVVSNRRYRDVFYPGITVATGTPFERIMKKAAQKGLVPVPEDRLDAWVKEQVAQHRNPGDAYLQQWSDGRWVQITERRTADEGTIVVLTDITQLKEVELELRERERRLSAQSLEETLLHRAAEMAAETDSFEDALQQVVDMVCEMTGWPVGHIYEISPENPDLLVTTTIWHLEDPDAYSVFQEVTERTHFLVGEGLPGRILKSGEPAWITNVQTDPNFPRNKLARDLGVKGAFGFPVKISGEVVAVLEFFADQEVSPDENLMQTIRNVGEQLSRVFERKRAEEELRQARQAADAANLAKSEFLSNMSHELRTPLNGVLGYAQILQRDPTVTPAHRESLDAIETCGLHLLTLINDVLDLSKIEAGRLEVNRVPCDLHRLVKNIFEIVSPRAESKGLTFSTEIAAEVPKGILTDPTKLKQVLVNLAGNAVKFTDEGSVTLRVRKLQDIGLQLEVEDTGMGMTPEELEEVFDPFKQAEGGKKSGGTGLGLPISKRLVEALGGTLEVESQPGQGSRFMITHPLVEVPEQDLSKLVKDTLTDQRSLVLAPGQDVTVLVVDDLRETRDVLVKLLEGAGFDTREARDGKEAVEKLREYDISVVLMDLRMPVMDGMEAAQEIRNDPTLKDKVLIAVSASVLSNRERAREVGFDDFIGKPFRASEVFDKIKHHLKVRYTTSAQEVPPDSEQESVTLRDQKLPPEVAREVARRVQEAVQLGDVSELTAVATELTQRNDFTSPYGKEIARLARAFDFEGLSQLANTLVETNPPSREKA